MKEFPPIPDAEDAPPELFDGGHLWLQEKVDGAHLRFQLRDSGMIRFGGRDRVFRDEDDVPEAYRHAVRHVRERLDRAALREAVENPGDVVFFGEATHAQTVDYDWDRLPSFLGFDVWSAATGGFLPPDSVEKIYRRLALDPVNTFEKEVRAADFDPERYEIPASNWYDGPAAGVVVRNKTGQRAQIRHPDVRDEDGGAGVAANSPPRGAEALAREYATERRFETVARDLRDRGYPVSFDALYDRVVEAIVRENHHRLFDDPDLDFGAFRSAVAARTRQYLDERE